jgi:hypothetical protein
LNRLFQGLSMEIWKLDKIYTHVTSSDKVYTPLDVGKCGFLAVSMNVPLDMLCVPRIDNITKLFMICKPQARSSSDYHTAPSVAAYITER